VRGDSDGLFLHEGKQLNSARLDDGLGVDGDLGPAAAVLRERKALAAQQSDTTRT
jgi:hypothetical protein